MARLGRAGRQAHTRERLLALARDTGSALAGPAGQAATPLGIGTGVQGVADPIVPTTAPTDILRLALGIPRIR